MRIAEYKIVKQEIENLINQGYPLKAAHRFEELDYFFSQNQYQELVDLIYNAVEGKRK